MKKSLLQLQITDKEFKTLMDSIENKSVFDDMSHSDILNVAINIFMSEEKKKEKKEKTRVKELDTEKIKEIKEVKKAEKAKEVKGVQEVKDVKKAEEVKETVKAEKPVTKVIEVKREIPPKPSTKTLPNIKPTKKKIKKIKKIVKIIQKPKGSKSVKTEKAVKPVKSAEMPEVKKIVEPKKAKVSEPVKIAEEVKEVKAAGKETVSVPKPGEKVKTGTVKVKDFGIENKAKEVVKKEDDLVNFALGFFNSTAEEIEIPVAAAKKPVEKSDPSSMDSVMNPPSPVFDVTGAFVENADLMDSLMNPPPPRSEQDLMDAMMNPPPPSVKPDVKDTDKINPQSHGKQSDTTGVYDTLDMMEVMMNPQSPSITAAKTANASSVAQAKPAEASVSTMSPIEEMLAASAQYDFNAPPKEPVKTEVGASNIVSNPPKMKKTGTTLNSDDWMAIIDGGSAPKVEETVAVVKETPVAAVEKVVPVATPGAVAPTEKDPAEEAFSPDDWMDMMEGKDAASGTATAEVDPQTLEYALKDAPDYTIKHAVPERQEFKIKEKTGSRDGMRKKDMFYQTKVSFKSRFGGSKKKPGKICSICGKGDKAKECVSCGNSNATLMTRVCEKCASNKKVYNKCIICGNANPKIIGRLCENCRGMARTCIICGGKL